MRKSDFTLPTLDDLFSTQAERDDAKLERVRDIPLAGLRPFKGHPFKVQNNEEMQRMIESIRKVGAITPALARPLPDPVYEMLCEEREKQDLYRRMFKGSYNRKYDDYICVDQLGGLIRPNRVTQRFADLIRQYGLRKIRFHDLRHTFASILINQDVPLLNVSTFLGHSDLSTTANIYAHLDKSKKQESADVISSIFNKAKE